MRKVKELPAGWRCVEFPPDLRPVPLDGDLRPIDADILKSVDGRANLVFFIAPATARLNPELIDLVRPSLARRPEVGVFYGDDAVAQPGRAPHDVYCKPAFNKALLCADDYIGFPLLVRGSAFAATPYEPCAVPGADWYRYCFEALRAGVSFERIPHTLIAHAVIRRKAERKSREKILASIFASEDAPLAALPGATADTTRIMRRFRNDHPVVTLVVPTRQSAPEGHSENVKPHIVNLLDSLANSTWPASKLKVLIGDDEPSDAIYRDRKDKFQVKRIVTQRRLGEPFNYAAKMNRLWREAESEHIVLMNDDVIVRAPDWLESLLTFAMDEDVGGVGGKLLLPDGRIQHAGMFGEVWGICIHPWYTKPSDDKTYCDWAVVQRDCTIVTGALFATRRSVMEAVNGMDESFSLDFNDVDLCLKMRMLGYRIVYEPFAEMAHHEKGSRKASFAPGSQTHLFLKRWRDFLREDPMYSPQLRIDTDDIAPHPNAFMVD
ncbi:glycosyltransferase family 2 protein [Methylocystis sp. JAN1]|uniref:glycosyltransferase family 2 protein n=1 Tax=Methylocystis sp. JAN1 TaxID=3397211 RepID=UPI003FA2832D